MVVTGVSPAGIGSSTALAIASQGPEALILASRTESKLDSVAADIGQKYPLVNTHKITLDLSSLDSVREAAARIDGLADHIDVLINNAGISSQVRDPVRTPGDTLVDLNFLTNHLGPFLLTSLLLPKLRAASTSRGAARIVNVSSHAHHLSPVRFHDYQLHHYAYDGVPDGEKPPRGIPDDFLRLVDGYPGFIGYAQSKTANILHAAELARRLGRAGDGSGVTALAVHPGTIDTELSRSLDEEGLRIIGGTAPGGRWKTLDQGAATTIVAAFDPKIAELDLGGEVVGYFADCQLGDQYLADHAKDPENARVLFEESERMLGVRTGL